MERDSYNFIIVGAGQNILTAAAYLAAAGSRILVLEKDTHWGGGCATKEVTLPGFKHDVRATNVFMAKANPLLRYDELGLLSRFGLAYAETDNAYHGTIFEDGSSVQLYTDLERSCESIARHSMKDGRAYRDFIERTKKYIQLLSFGMFLPPADSKTFVDILNSSHEGRELLHYFNSSAWDIVNTLFEDPHTQIHLLRLTTEMMVKPESPGTAFALMFMAGLYHTYTSGCVIGGSQSFSDALARCIQHHGGIIKTQTEVKKVIVENGRATGVETTGGDQYKADCAVIASLPPWKLSDFVAGTKELTQKVQKVPISDYTIILSHLALKEPPRPICDEQFHTMFFNALAPLDVEAVLRITRDVSAGRMPKDFSTCYVCATNLDPSRAPEGKATLYLYHIMPNVPEGKRIEDWQDIKEETGRWQIENTREKYIPNLTDDNILAAVHCTPQDISNMSPSYLKGDVAALGMFPDQFIYGRPIPELAQYRVPGVQGLYLAGPFMHPGGGANGGGRAAAIRVMMDFEMDLDRVFTL